MKRFHGLGICMVANFPPSAAGIPIQAETLSRHLEEEGATIYRICRERRGFLKPARTLIGLLRWGRRCDLIQVQGTSYWGFFRAVMSVLVARLYRKPVVLWYHGGAAPRFFPRFRWVTMPILQRADVLVVPSGFLREVFARYGFEARIIGNLILPWHWRYRERQSLQPHLLWVRHLRETCNPAMAIRAFALVKQRFPEATLTFAGAGTLRAPLEAMVRKMGLEGVRFLGAIYGEALSQVYDEAEIFINTAYTDNQPATVIEAFAHGLPVISTNVGGVPYLIEDGRTGLLIAPDDHAALAAKIIELLQDPAQARRLSWQAWEAAQRHAWPAVREEWARLYQEISARG